MVVRLETFLSVIFFTVNNDKKIFELCRVVKLLKIKWLSHVSGIGEIKKTCSIVNKTEHQIPLKISGVYNRTILKSNARKFGASV